ncbi:hypothetical protein HYFRA_00000787 [Hymenoscyphus fraxineus]|uniref:Uncharacterized protein n=1 Tax=Hymenoscyphus fraxineus TaxID=746836 RepID=A0A9N9KS02_9HELO|nr:hypothetical protein HYFRA_00000787 [Hymenoscyphus fraxineus]
MSQKYTCKARRCQLFTADSDKPSINLDTLDEVIEHLRSAHKLTYIRRPNRLGIPDTHGHLWYCFHVKCETREGKDHRSFRSDGAMWDHLNACHDWDIDGIV